MISLYILQCREINESGSFEEDQLEKYISNVLDQSLTTFLECL